MRLIDHRVLPLARSSCIPEVVITCDDAKVLDVGAYSNETNDVLVSKLPIKSEKNHCMSVSISFSFSSHLLLETVCDPVCFHDMPFLPSKGNLLQDVDLMLHFRDIHLCKVLHTQLPNRHRFLQVENANKKHLD